MSDSRYKTAIKIVTELEVLGWVQKNGLATGINFMTKLYTTACLKKVFD